MKTVKVSPDKTYKTISDFRGLFALDVVLSHIWGNTGIPALLPFNKCVTIVVGFFFILSGYRTISAADKDDAYISHIIKKKIPQLLFMALIAFCIGVLLEIVLSVRVKYLPGLSLKGFFICTNWYIWELLGFWILFIFVFKALPRKYQLGAIWGGTLVWFVILYYIAPVEAWYNSIIGFPIGAYYARHKDEQYIRGSVLFLAIAFEVVAFASMFVIDTYSIIFAVLRNLTLFASFIILVWICHFLREYELPIFCKYLSRLSGNIYFFHIPIAIVLASKIQNVWLYSFCTILLTFVLAIIWDCFRRKPKNMN